MRRAATFATALVMCWGLAAGSASAHSLVRPGGAVVSYLSADATSLNTLEARVSGNRIEFRDASVDGGMDPGSCTPGEIDRSGYIIQTFCPLAGVQRVRIDLGEREDIATLELPLAATVLAGPGADRVTAGGEPDELGGGEGNDELDGGPGDDVLSGDRGADALTGGPGSDRIAARDGEADNISCGEGGDTVDADTLDLLTSDCENVTRTATTGPGASADDGLPPRLEVGAPTLQRLGRSRKVRVYATSSERGAISASGSLEVAGLALPVKTIERQRVRVGGGGVVLTYRLRGRHLREAVRGLRRGKRVVVRLGVVATDLTGTSSERDAPPITLVGGRASRSGAAVLARAAHPEPGDVDGDEVPDEFDNCPTVKNGSQLNTDANLPAENGMPSGDGFGDACDDDDDADGVLDAKPDNCRVDRNPLQEDTDGDGYGDACPPTHSDSDGIIDDNDNCDFDANPDQSDLDGDDRGDACDRDDDGDKFDDPYDNCPTVYNLEPNDVNGDGLVNDQLDRDGDGVGTACDPDESVVGGPGGTGGNDRRAPSLRVGAGRRYQLAAVRAGVVVRLRCSEACGATVELIANRRTARALGLGRSRVLAGGSARLLGAGTTYAFVRFDRRAWRALSRRGGIRVTLAARAVDDAGNRRQLSRYILIGRRGSG